MKQANVWSTLHSHTEEEEEKNEIFVELNIWHNNWVKLKVKTCYTHFF